MSEKILSDDATSATVVPDSLSPTIRESDLSPADPNRYAMADEVGRGGLGRILLARDKQLGRYVAIKELLEVDADLLARFAREALVTARLMHPAIVPVYDAGKWPNGMPFYAMKMVTGKSLDKVIDAAPTLHDRLALLPNTIAVCEAMAYAHSERIIHRDLKPANVLVGSFGETVVIDWGLAKDLRSAEDSLPTGPFREASGGETVAGSVLGTPSYMPLEQALGESVVETADVYALGALLYHVLAGRAPYLGKSANEVLAKVLSGPPEPLAEEVPAELRAIVDKAMSRNPKQRYPTAGELATDLKRYTTGQLVSAHVYSPGMLLRRWIAKRRGVVTIAAIATVALIGVGVYAYRQVGRQRDVAEANALEASTRADEASLAQAEALLDRDPSGTIRALSSLSEKAPWDRVRRIALEANQRGLAVRELQLGDGATAIGILPTGAAVVANAATIYRWNVATGETAKIADLPSRAKGVWLSPDGATIAVERHPGGFDHRNDDGAQLIDVATGALHPYLVMNRLFGIAFSPDGKRVALGGGAGIAVVNVETGERRDLAITDEHLAKNGASVAFTPDGKLIIAGTTDSLYRCDSACTQIPDAIPDANQIRPLPLAISRANRVVFGGLRSLGVLDLATGEVDRSSFDISASATDIEITPDAGWLAASLRSRADVDRDGELYLHQNHGSARHWSPGGELEGLAIANDRAVVGSAAGVAFAGLVDGRRSLLRGQRDAVTSIAIRGEQVISGSRDGTVRLWHVPAPELPCGMPSLNHVAFADGIAVGWTEAGIAVCEGEHTRIVPAKVKEWMSAAIAPDKKSLAAADGDQLVRIDLATGEVKVVNKDPITTVRWTSRGAVAWTQLTAIAFDAQLEHRREIFTLDTWAGFQVAPDLAHGLLAPMEGMPKILDLDTMDVTMVPPHTAFEFSPDGKRAALVDKTDRLLVIDLASGGQLAMKDKTDYVFDVKWTPDGKHLATLGGDTLRLWDVTSGTSRIALRVAGHNGIRDLVFSPDSQRVAAITADNFAYLVEVATGESTLLGRTDGQSPHLTFWPDGKTIALVAKDHTMIYRDDLPRDADGLRTWLAQHAMLTTAVR